MTDIKDIIGYLPYGLRVAKGKLVHEINGFWKDQYTSGDEYVEDYYDSSSFKPLVLPIEEKSISDEALLEIVLSLGYKTERLDLAWKYLNGGMASWIKDHSKAFDIIHANMIDYRNLIGQGLALDLRGYE